jgi:hypothetical protein
VWPSVSIALQFEDVLEASASASTGSRKQQQQQSVTRRSRTQKTTHIHLGSRRPKNARREIEGFFLSSF